MTFSNPGPAPVAGVDLLKPRPGPGQNLDPGRRTAKRGVLRHRGAIPKIVEKRKFSEKSGLRFLKIDIVLGQFKKVCQICHVFGPNFFEVIAFLALKIKIISKTDLKNKFYSSIKSAIYVTDIKM